jgi:hypothetical protein
MDRLQRAISHFVFLMQQAYKAAHNDPNDPFAPK